MGHLFNYEHTIVMYQSELSGPIPGVMAYPERSSARPASMRLVSIVSLDIDDDGGNTGPYDDDGDPD